MRVLIGRAIRWFLDGAKPQFRHDGQMLRTKVVFESRAEVDAALRALTDTPWQCPCCLKLRVEVAELSSAVQRISLPEALVGEGRVDWILPLSAREPRP
jgi:hypothetical protein